MPLDPERPSLASPLRLQPLLRCSFAKLAYFSYARQLLSPGFRLAALPVVDRLCADTDQLAHVGGRYAEFLAQCEESGCSESQRGCFIGRMGDCLRSGLLKPCDPALVLY